VQHWQHYRDLAHRVLAKDLRAYHDVLIREAAFEELAAFQTQVNIEQLEEDVVALGCAVSDQEVVPREEAKLTASGKLTTKTMPASRYWSLFQDFVCSSAIRAATETFAVLPINRCIVHMTAQRTNPGTGYQEAATLISVQFVRDILDQLNLDAVDPSEAIKNFPNRMKFKKTTGFDPVQRIGSNEVWAG